MAMRRLIYLAVLALSGIFYIAYGQWLSWLILITVAALPWFSLLLALPAMFRFRAVPSTPGILELGQSGELWLMGSAPWPMPPFRGRLKLTRLITGESWYYQEPEDLTADHCGGIAVTVGSLWISDYLGLFSFPAKSKEREIILIRPKPVPMKLQREIQEYVARRWKPKPGGGYAENHELRLYRPGDSLNQVHWKLSAKTGDLIIREPMEPESGQMLLTMTLRGSAEALDRKFGRLLWLGTFLLEQELRFEIQVLTGNGVQSFPVDAPEALGKAIDALLCCPAAQPGDQPQWAGAAWHCHIGGEPDEA